MKTDLSPHAVSTRIRRVSQLRRLCLSLRSATDSRAPDSNEVPMPESHKPLLDAAVADHSHSAEEGRRWDEVRDDVFGKL